MFLRPASRETPCVVKGSWCLKLTVSMHMYDQLHSIATEQARCALSRTPSRAGLRQRECGILRAIQRLAQRLQHGSSRTTDNILDLFLLLCSPRMLQVPEGPLVGGPASSSSTCSRGASKRARQRRKSKHTWPVEAVAMRTKCCISPLLVLLIFIVVECIGADGRGKRYPRSVCHMRKLSVLTSMYSSAQSSRETTQRF